MAASYPKLFTPLRIAGHSLPNRIVMGAMHTRLETMDRPLERMAAFYAERARGEVGLILTGGFSPVPEGVMDEGGPLFNSSEQVADHRRITSAVHEAGGRIVLQILHAGRYARVATCVAPSALKARINAFAPRALSTQEVWDTIERFAESAALAQQAGYDGVEIMGSEGYLLNEFTAALTNLREDEFGGSFENRLRLPLEIIRRVRARVGREFMLIYRISSIDLVEGGMTGAEIARFAAMVEAAGADLINTGVGWHEAGVPTIAASVPRAAWVDAVANVKRAVKIPVMASNRINTPQVAEELLASGCADLVSMARPLLADSHFARKARAGKAEEINTCIACNQACLDRIFSEQVASCLVNPKAGRELDYPAGKAARAKRIAVIGGGAAGMACALNAAERGHTVSLFEAAPQLGGQLNLARVVPGKGEFNETLRYFRVMLERSGVKVELGRAARVEDIQAGQFDEVVLANGVLPRVPQIAGLPHPKVVNYVDVLSGRVQVGERVAIIGAGGIGFDVAEYLLDEAAGMSEVPRFLDYWGVDANIATPGGLKAPQAAKPRRQITMLQRKPESPGRTLGKSTGWILKARLRKAGVKMLPGVRYEAIDDRGLHISLNGAAQVLQVDHVVLCAGQESNRDLYRALSDAGLRPHLIGGAERAEELDALRAIEQATQLAYRL